MKNETWWNTFSFGGRPNFHANPHQWIDLFDLRFIRESNCRISHGLSLLSSRKGFPAFPHISSRPKRPQSGMMWIDVLSPISPEMGGRNQTSVLVGLSLIQFLNGSEWDIWTYVCIYIYMYMYAISKSNLWWVYVGIAEGRQLPRHSEDRDNGLDE